MVTLVRKIFHFHALTESAEEEASRGEQASTVVEGVPSMC